MPPRPIANRRLLVRYVTRAMPVYLVVIQYMDNHGNSRATTCDQTRLRGGIVFIRYRTNLGDVWCFGYS